MFTVMLSQVGTTIYPIAMKYDSRFGDAFWNSSQQGWFEYLMQMMTSWAIICHVWYLPPMVKLVAHLSPIFPYYALSIFTPSKKIGEAFARGCVSTGYRLVDFFLLIVADFRRGFYRFLFCEEKGEHGLLRLLKVINLRSVQPK